MAHRFKMRLRAVLFGNDADPYFDVRDFQVLRMGERTKSERFIYRWISPTLLKVFGWMDDCDYRFRMRYSDVRAKQRAGR